jgi:hypothetical protein
MLRVMGGIFFFIDCRASPTPNIAISSLQLGSNTFEGSRQRSEEEPDAISQNTTNLQWLLHLNISSTTSQLEHTMSMTHSTKAVVVDASLTKRAQNR